MTYLTHNERGQALTLIDDTRRFVAMSGRVYVCLDYRSSEGRHIMDFVVTEEIEEKTKICAVCGIDKALSAFDRRRQGDGYKGTCRGCCQVRQANQQARQRHTSAWLREQRRRRLQDEQRRREQQQERESALERELHHQAQQANISARIQPMKRDERE